MYLEITEDGKAFQTLCRIKNLCTLGMQVVNATNCINCGKKKECEYYKQTNNIAYNCPLYVSGDIKDHWEMVEEWED